jgi:hypothetical protein
MAVKLHRYALLFLAICLVYLSTLSDSYLGLISDGRDMFETAVSLHDFGELAIPAEHYPIDGPAVEIERYAKYGLGFSIVQQVPLLFAAGVEKMFGEGRSNVLFALTNMLLTALTSLLVALCLRDLGFRFRTATWAALAFSFGTFAWPYISYDFSEPLQAFCLTASFWLLIQAVKSSPPSCFFLVLAGFVLGFSVLTKGFLLILIPSYVLYLWMRLESPLPQRAASLTWFALPLGFWSPVIASLNLYRFGSVFDFGYGSETTQFTTPLAIGLYGLLLSPNKGLVFYAPVVAVVPWSLWKIFRRQRCEFVFFMSVFVIYILPTSMWWSWEGGTSWGPRLLLPIVPLFVVSAAMLLDEVKSSVIPFATCVVIGVGVNLLGVLVSIVMWNYVLELNNGIRVPLNVSGRPVAEYIERDGKKWFSPAVASSYLPSLSPILGHAWLLRLRYFERPFSLSTLKDETSVPPEPVNFPPVQTDFSLLRGTGTPLDYTIWQLRSAHFWLWDTLLRQPREEPFSYSIYGWALSKQGDRAMAQNNPKRALQCFRRALELIPNSAVTAMKLSQVQLQMETPLEAEQTLVQFLERRPQEALARLQLAHLYEVTGNRKAALHTYYTYQALHPGDEYLPIVQQRIAELSAGPTQ